MWKTWTGGPAAGPIASPNTAGPGAPSMGGWHPTVIYLLALVLAEILVVGLLSRTVLR